MFELYQAIRRMWTFGLGTSSIAIGYGSTITLGQYPSWDEAVVLLAAMALGVTVFALVSTLAIGVWTLLKDMAEN